MTLFQSQLQLQSRAQQLHANLQRFCKVIVLQGMGQKALRTSWCA
jgi:hypothetical protein